MRRAARVAALAALCAAAPAVLAAPAEVLAGAPSDLSVTVYRSPGRDSGQMALDYLEGFALIRETRLIRLPAGENRVRFEGVADGIEPASAIVTGLPQGVVEKNRDARLLSPASLVAAAAGKPVTLMRSNPKTGKVESLSGTILSDTQGVVFQTSAGIEALRCSGLPESFTFTSATGLSATPTLSVLVRADAPVTRTVTLAYLARGFDWNANYTATLSRDGKTLDLGAWVTLANGNGVGFPAARTQVVAGRVNREDTDVEPIDVGGPVLAQCWPRGTTSDLPPPMLLRRSREEKFEGVAMASPMAVQEVAVTGSRVSQEQLGDLKLYRVPERTTVASRQSKQVRLLDRASIPVERVYAADLSDHTPGIPFPASLSLRTRNNAANHLGLPLPSGQVAVFATRSGGEALLVNQADVRDLAVNEEVVIEMGESADVEVQATTEERNVSARSRGIPLVPGLSLREADVSEIRRVEVTNARTQPAQCELRLRLDEGTQVVRADHALTTRQGRPAFRLTVAAQGSAVVRYQTARISRLPTRE